MIFETMFHKLEAVRPKCVGDDQLRASFDIRPVDLGHGRGLGEIKFIKTFVKADAVRVEHGSHGAIGQKGFCGESFQQARQSCG